MLFTLYINWRQLGFTLEILDWKLSGLWYTGMPRFLAFSFTVLRRCGSFGFSPNWRQDQQKEYNLLVIAILTLLQQCVSEPTISSRYACLTQSSYYSNFGGKEPKNLLWTKVYKIILLATQTPRTSEQIFLKDSLA